MRSNGLDSAIMRSNGLDSASVRSECLDSASMPAGTGQQTCDCAQSGWHSSFALCPPGWEADDCAHCVQGSDGEEESRHEFESQGESIGLQTTWPIDAHGWFGAAVQSSVSDHA